MASQTFCKFFDKNISFYYHICNLTKRNKKLCDLRKVKPTDKIRLLAKCNLRTLYLILVYSTYFLQFTCYHNHKYAFD
ncbi:hypothetical protein CV679_05580 [Borreliella burgdorferi]|nr:hypothetical protein CV679_05580 [Borreliella burgdorferi]